MTQGKEMQAPPPPLTLTAMLRASSRLPSMFSTSASTYSTQQDLAETMPREERSSPPPRPLGPAYVPRSRARASSADSSSPPRPCRWQARGVEAPAGEWWACGLAWVLSSFLPGWEGVASRPPGPQPRAES